MPTFSVWLATEAIHLDEGRRVVALSQGRLDLVAIPDVIRPLFSLRLGVERGIEPSLRGRQFSVDETKRGFGLGAPPRGLGDLESSEVNRGKLGVFGKHGLEVRNDPATVGGIAMIAAAQVVSDASTCHP